MQKTAIYLSVIIFFLSCDQQNQKTSVSYTIISETSSVDSTLFILKEKSYTAVLKRVNNNATGKAHGPTVWVRTGSLPLILPKLYGGPVELEKNPYSKYNYTLEINWSEETTFEKIRDKIAAKMKETFGYAVKTETREEPKYILSINDRSKLERNTETDFVKEGVTSKIKFENEDWQIYTSLNKLAEILREKTNSMVELEKDYGSVAYYFKLTASGGIESLISQLQQDYGLAIQKKTVPVKYYIIRFE